MRLFGRRALAPDRRLCYGSTQNSRGCLWVRTN